MNFKDLLDIQINNTSKSKKEGFSVEYQKALQEYLSVYLKCGKIADRICAGEVVPDTETIPYFMGLKSAYENYVSEKAKLFPDAKPIPLIRYGIPDMSEQLVMDANKFISKGMSESDAESFEKGLWYQTCYNNY